MPDVLWSDADPTDAVALAQDVGQKAAPFAAQHDLDATFVTEGFASARESGYALVAVPKDLGGRGHGLIAVCLAQAEMARWCASTALAIAMHQHFVLTMAWRRNRGDVEGERVLRKLVDEDLLMAISGSLSPANITLTAERREGGFVVSGSRPYCSASPGADALFCVAQLETPSSTRPLSLLVPLRADGVEIVDDWDSMGMRGSGSNTVRLDDAFVPDDNVMYLDRRRPRLHPASNLPGPPLGLDVLAPGLHISLTVIAASYFGAASGVCDEAIKLAARSARADSPATNRLAGLMINEERVGRWALEAMLRQTTDESLGSREQMVTTMLGKRQVILSSIRTAELAMELLGASSYMRRQTFERALRDVRAGITHPLTPEQTLFTVGRANLALAAAEADSQS
jgi:alkylation response protein AidB-like acyl-CoA dehydrogenase